MVTITSSAATNTDFTASWNNFSFGLSVTSIYYIAKNILKRGLYFATKEEMSNFFAKLSWTETFEYLTTQFIPEKKFKIKQDIGWKQHILNKRRFAVQAL